jgi:RNA polymerase sigma factor (sigma-70 family)
MLGAAPACGRNTTSSPSRRIGTRPLNPRRDPRLGPPLDHLADRATHERARHAVQALPERQREVVTLRVLGELSTRETAHAMGCAEGTVKASLSQALASLRTKLAHEIHINMHDE